MNNIECLLPQSELIKRCQTILELKELVDNFEGCALKKEATHTVFADGNPNAKIMLVGEAPGMQEDIEGRPFCGRSGKLLDSMLNAIGLDREAVYITNTIYWRPPANRKPTPKEIATCRPFLEKHIALVRPAILVLVGSVAASVLLPNIPPISKSHGQFYTYSNAFITEKIPATLIFHPAYLLRKPDQKRLAWTDLKLIKQYIENNNIVVN